MRQMVRTRVMCGGGEAIAEYPGAPTAVPGLWVADTPWGYAVIIHRTGRSMGAYPDPEVALAAASDFGATGIDFTLPGPELEPYLLASRARGLAILEWWGGRNGTAPANWDDLP